MFAADSLYSASLYLLDLSTGCTNHRAGINVSLSYQKQRFRFIHHSMVSYAQVSSEIISVVATVLHSNDPRREQKHSDDMALVRIGGRLAAKLSVILLEGRLRDKDYSERGLVPLTKYNFILSFPNYV